MNSTPSLPRRIINRGGREIQKFRQEHRMAFYNIGYRLIGSLDGYPLPPENLVDLVIGTKEVAWYQLGGLFMHQAITNILHRNEIDVNALGSILDFGCGCGRLIRWFAALGTKGHADIWGCDYNPLLVAWCQEHLSEMGHFLVNRPEPPLDFPSNKFEFVYSYSVFTHLAAHLQEPWMAEMARVTQPGGHLLITVHGKRVLLRDHFPDEFIQRMEDQGFLVHGEENSGTNYCSVYHSEKYMLEQERNGLQVVEYIPAGARDGSEQDIYLYRKVK